MISKRTTPDVPSSKTVFLNFFLVERTQKYPETSAAYLHIKKLYNTKIKLTVFIYKIILLQWENWACFLTQIQSKRGYKVSDMFTFHRQLLKVISTFWTLFLSMLEIQIPKIMKMQTQKKFNSFQGDCRVQSFDRKPKLIEISIEER